MLMLVAYTNSAWAGWTGPTSTVELVSARRCSGEVKFSVRAFDGVISPQPGLYVLANGTGVNSTTVTSGYKSVTDGASNIMCKRISGSTVTNLSQWCKFGDDYTSYSDAGGQIVATVSYDLDKPYAGDRILYVGWDSKPWSYGVWTESNHWIGHASSGSCKSGRSDLSEHTGKDDYSSVREQHHADETNANSKYASQGGHCQTNDEYVNQSGCHHC